MAKRKNNNNSAHRVFCSLIYIFSSFLLPRRNCVVNKNLIIKISDHAMYCNKYEREYYVNECYTKVPLRWMAWEAILLV